MAASFSLSTTLAALPGGNQPVSLIDALFTQVYSPLVSLNTYSNYYADSGSANAYIASVASPQTVTLSAGLEIQFKAANTNTGASTLNVGGTGVKNILNPDGSALGAGQIQANGIVVVQYDGTQYQLITSGSGVSSVQLQDAAAFTLTAVGGTANAITANANPAIAAYSTGQTFEFTPTAVNTGATTININGVGAVSIKVGGTALGGGELLTNLPARIKYDGTQFQFVGGQIPQLHGTWTPGITFGGGTTGQTFSAQAGEYIKEGTKFTCWFRITFTNKGSSSGSAVLTGLPGTVANLGSMRGGGSPVIFYTGGNSTGMVALSPTPNAATADLYQFANPWTAITDANFTNASDLSGCVVFHS